MRHWSVQRIAGTIGGTLLREQAGGRAAGGPGRTVIDSRAIQPGDLFFGLPGEQVDGGAFAVTALEAGAWGVVVQPQWADELLESAFEGAVISSELPVPALGALARAWRQDLAAFVIAVTGSVGKTSTKDLVAAMITPHRKVAALARELQHRDRAAARGARGAVRHRGAGARAGHARSRPDRRAGGDLRARRRRDHEHRPRPPRAARLARGRRGGQGRAARRDGGGLAPASCPPTSRCSSRGCATTSRSSRSAPAATSTSRAPR